MMTGFVIARLRISRGDLKKTDTALYLLPEIAASGERPPRNDLPINYEDSENSAKIVAKG